jgi:hypothetical protein
VIGRECSKHGRDRNAKNISAGKMKGRNLPEDLGVYGRIILKWILGK